MTHDQAVQALQTALAGVALSAGRAYPAMLPQGVVFPAMRWSIVSATANVAICGSTEEGDDIRIQLDCIAHEYGQMRQLRAQALAAIEAITAIEIHRESERELPFDEDARAFRVSMDFIISLSNV